MKRFTRILLIANGKNWRETAFERAVSLAKENQADLTVIDVVDFSGKLQAMGREKLDRFKSNIIDKRLAQLDNMVQHLRDRVAISNKSASRNRVSGNYPRGATKQPRPSHENGRRQKTTEKPVGWQHRYASASQVSVSGMAYEAG